MDNQRRRYVVGTVLALVLSLVGIIGCFAVIWGWRGGVMFHHRRHVDEDPPVTTQYDPTSVELVTSTPLAQTTGDSSADDGELHDARNLDVSYRFREGFWAKSQVEHLDAYDMDANCSFSVSYPVLAGSGEHIEEVNALLRETAMKTVHTYYEDPSDETVKKLKTVLGDSNDPVLEEDTDCFLQSHVTYAVSYNTEDFISVCFSDNFCMGSILLEFVELRTVNVNLKTGEVYELDDALEVDEEIANSFLDNLVLKTGHDENGDGVITDDECLPVSIAGREDFVAALRGEGPWAERVQTCLFVDGEGKPNLGATYWVSNDDGIARGWWDVTITDDQLEMTRKDSGFWGMLH